MTMLIEIIEFTGSICGIIVLSLIIWEEFY